MTTRHGYKSSLYKLLIGTLIGISSAMSTSSHAECNEETLTCKNEIVSDLKRKIERLEIDNAELRYDVDDLRNKLKVNDKKLNLCAINLKNITVEMRACGK